MKRMLRSVLCLLLALLVLAEPAAAQAAYGALKIAAPAADAELIAEDAFLIPGPEDYFGQARSLSFNDNKKRLEYTFPASVNPKTKMKQYAAYLEEDFGLTVKADGETDEGYMVRLTCGSKNGLRLEWFREKKELVVFCYTRLLPKATESSRTVLTLGAKTYPEAAVENLVKTLDRKLSMTEKNSSVTSGTTKTRNFTKGGKDFLKIGWSKSAGNLTIAAYDEDILEAMGLEERYYIDKNSAALPDLEKFLGRKPDSDQWNYARAITFSVEKTKGEKAFKEVLALLKEDRYQLEQTDSWSDNYLFRYNGTNDDIDWVNHTDGYSYHVKLTKVTYSHKLEITLYCWPEFYTEDPGSRSAYAGQLKPAEPEPTPDPTKPTGGGGGGGGNEQCGTCFGSGKCWACSGKGGKYKNIIGEPWKQVFEACRVCHNGKKCTSCKGKGYK